MLLFSKKKDKLTYNNKIIIQELIGCDDIVINDGCIIKDKIILAIHDQIHIISLRFRDIIIANASYNLNKSLNHKVINANNQISRVFNLNFYSSFAIEYFENSSTLTVYAFINDEPTIINKVFLIIIVLIINSLL